MCIIDYYKFKIVYLKLNYTWINYYNIRKLSCITNFHKIMNLGEYIFYW